MQEIAVSTTSKLPSRPSVRDTRSAATPMEKSMSVKIAWSAIRIQITHFFSMPACAASCGRKMTYTVQQETKKNWTAAK